MIRRILSITVLCGLGLAAWQIWGDGSFVNLLNNIWAGFVWCVEGIARVAVTAFTTITEWVNG